MDVWWERYPGLLEAEKEALDRLGYRWEIDEDARQNGQLVIHVEYPNSKECVWNLRAEFPATYPYFPPIVILEDVALSRHHHPVSKNLCLLARNGEDWQPQHDSLAILLSEQIPKILVTTSSAADTLEDAAQQEDHIGEPLASFVEYADNSVLIVPDEVPDPAVTSGRLSILAKPLPAKERTNGNMQGVVSAILDLERHPLITLDVALPSHTLHLDGYWMRLAKRPVHTDTHLFRRQLVSLMERTIPSFKRNLMTARPGQTLVAGFIYEDETSWRTTGQDWVFLLMTVQAKSKNRNTIPELTMTTIRADRGGEKTWMQRAPILLPMRTKKVLLFGAGSLGSPIALHLARAGLGRLTIIDDDYLQVGNTIRWALGWQYAGLAKVSALKEYIRQNYPYTEVDTQRFILGNLNFAPPNTQGPRSDYEVLREKIIAADVVIDAAASYRVSHFLSDLAVELGKPYVWLTTTHGCEGGIVGRRIPGSEYGCWHCHNFRLSDGSIPLPPDASTGEIQPTGCSQATFVGAGIDSEEIALMASRLAVATLSRDQEAYGDFDWNVGVCEIYRDGRPIAPIWHTSELPIHPDCCICAKK